MMDEEPERRARRRLTIGGLLSDGVGDLGQLVRLVPEIASALRAIQKHTKNMDLEVTGMHASVERLEVEVRQLRSQIAELDNRMGTVAAAVVRLEPHIQDVNLAMRPLRRARSRFPGRHAAPGREAAPGRQAAPSRQPAPGGQPAAEAPAGE
jgi:uncharacterized protein YoxC